MRQGRIQEFPPKSHWCVTHAVTAVAVSRGSSFFFLTVVGLQQKCAAGPWQWQHPPQRDTDTGAAGNSCSGYSCHSPTVAAPRACRHGLRVLPCQLSQLGVGWSWIDSPHQRQYIWNLFKLLFVSSDFKHF